MPSLSKDSAPNVQDVGPAGSAAGPAARTLTLLLVPMRSQHAPVTH
jgi:hypothetical protein